MTGGCLRSLPTRPAGTPAPSFLHIRRISIALANLRRGRAAPGWGSGHRLGAYLGGGMAA
ncbi:hypothetical protein MASR1M8_11510 [Thermomonas brevis]